MEAAPRPGNDPAHSVIFNQLVTVRRLVRLTECSHWIDLSERLTLRSANGGLHDPSCFEPDRSNFCTLRQLNGVPDIDAEVADGALDLGMLEEDLNGR